MDVDGARARLAAERLLAQRRLAALTGDYASVVEASRDSNADDEHDPEGATIAFERSQLGTLVRQLERHLAEIDSASARLEAGTYADCELCGEPIGEERLEARPTARRCIGCTEPVRPVSR